jgi:pimeloyl-ACP methyl ester carboxylesterase
MQRWRQASPLVRHLDLMALRSYPLHTALRLVRRPALVLAGEDGAGMPEGPWLQVLRMPATGCLPMLEQPELFSRAVRQFVAGLVAAGMAGLPHWEAVDDRK